MILAGKIQNNSHFLLAPKPSLARRYSNTTLALRTLNIYRSVMFRLRATSCPDLGMRGETAIRRGLLREALTTFFQPVTRLCLGVSSCPANQASRFRGCPVPFVEQSSHSKKTLASSEQLFGRSGRSSRRSISRNARAARNGRPISTSRATAILRWERSLSSSRKSAASGAGREN